MKNLTKKLSYAIYIVLATFLMVGCSGETQQVEQKRQGVANEIEDISNGRIIYDYGWNTKVRVFVVDSCEYIGFDAGTEGGTAIIHKQNCVNH